MHLLTAGDSWTFGSEIRDDGLPDTVADWDPENNAFRIPKIWPTLLSQRLNCTDHTNISYPASSNDRIVRHTISWITEHYLHDKKDTSDLFVVVGFTSPERKDFYYRDPVDSSQHGWTTIWPNQTNHEYHQRGMQPFFDNYRMYLWNQEEYLNRYVQQVTQLQNFFVVHGIQYYFFQAFYNLDETGITQWVDKGYINSENEKMVVGESNPRWHFHYNNQPDNWIWEQVDGKRFYGYYEAPHTFHGFITQNAGDREVIGGMHPNPHGHVLWCHELGRCIEELI